MMLTDVKRLRVGIISATNDLYAWEVECIRRLSRLDFVSLAVFAIRDGPAAARSHRESRLFPGQCPNALRGVRPDECFRHVPRISCNGDHLLSSDQDGPEVDVWICVTHFAEQSDPVLKSRFGTWVYQFGNDATENVYPPAISEYCAGHQTVAIRLLRLTGTDGNAITLKHGTVGVVQHSYRQTADKILFGVADFAAQACIDLKEHQSTAHRSAHETTYLPAAQYASRSLILRASRKQIERFVFRLFRVIFQGELWTLAFAQGDPSTLLLSEALRSPIYLKPISRSEYLADGFGLCIDGRRIILCERFGYRRAKGEIVWLELDAEMQIIAGPEIAIDLETHASFPYLFQHEGRIYCCPETQAMNSVSLWEAEGFPKMWRKKATLLHDVPGVDPIVFRHDARWWLFCTREDDEPNEKLFAWYADHLEGDWHPHQQNPIKIDVCSARNAGTPFHHDGMLHRPAQDCSKYYGWRVAINRISKLSPTEFLEETIRFVDPQPQSGFDSGLHTVARFGDGVLFDAKRHRFIWRDSVLKAKKHLAHQFVSARRFARTFRPDDD